MEGNVANTNGIRVLELPACRMATSLGSDLGAFDAWWSAIDKKRTDRFFPRDFMYFDAGKGEPVWLYAFSEHLAGECTFPVVDFPGGLYAAAISVDKDDKDGERVYGEIKAWINATGFFKDDESKLRPSLFHVITPDSAFAKMKYRQLDIYVPVK